MIADKRTRNFLIIIAIAWIAIVLYAMSPFTHKMMNLIYALLLTLAMTFVLRGILKTPKTEIWNE